MIRKLIVSFIIVQLLNPIKCSLGDRSEVFNKCLKKCNSANCTLKVNLHNKSFYDLNQPYYLKLLGWDCLEECKYTCMWETVSIFKIIFNEECPQFYGKWPFVRVLGIQEPVSALASVLNFIANLIMFLKMRKLLPRKAPFKKLWYAFSVVVLNTWFWSTVFHTRDTSFTERMDYFSAFLLVVFQFNSFFIRYFIQKKSDVAQITMYSISIGSFLYYLYHIYYLSSVNFDYGYNMKMNILFGLLNSACWLIWSYDRYFNKRLNYVWKCAFSVFLIDILMVFEVFDFSPILWALDSHALWHLSTVLIPYYWYGFIIDDNFYMQRITYEKIY